MSNIVIDNVLKRELQGRVYYFGTMPSDKIKAVTFVPVIEHSAKTPLQEDVNDGYQRPGSLTRMNQFRDFLKNHKHSVVPPVLLSGRGKWSFVPKTVEGVLGTITIEEKAAILDGQHRIGGFVALFEAEGDIRNVDFLLLEDLSRDDEIREFVTVNNTQVGVPKSLNLFLASDVEGLEGITGNLSEEARVAWALNKREDSPFLGRIARTKTSPEHLFQLHSVAKSIGRMFTSGAFKGTTLDEKIDITIKYWTLISQVFPNEWNDIERLGVPKQGRKAFDFKLLELTGFIAMSLVAGSIILPTSFNPTSRTMDWERVEKMLSSLDVIDWKKDGKYQHATGEVGGPIIRRDMEEILATNFF
jgi:DNA sulfur modification protein DndB